MHKRDEDMEDMNNNILDILVCESHLEGKEGLVELSAYLNKNVPGQISGLPQKP